MNREATKIWADGQNVRRLITERDLAGRSRSREEFPAYHDPIIQLVGVVAALVTSLLWSMTTEGVPQRISQALVIGSCLIGTAVLLRSVRNGWNVSLYGRTRRALKREATLRTERDALREVSLRCASLRRHGSSEEALDALQALTMQTQQALERSDQGKVSLAIVEDVDERFLVLCAAGFIQRRPFYVAPRKTCPADRPFSEVLSAFSPGGKVACKTVPTQERRYWIGLAAEDADAEIDRGALDTLAAWVLMLDDMALLSQAGSPPLKDFQGR
jgi:hypothetical protein